MLGDAFSGKLLSLVKKEKKKLGSVWIPFQTPEIRRVIREWLPKCVYTGAGVVK